MAFNQIRQYGRTSVAVTIRLLETIEACAIQVTDDDQRRILLRHAEMVFHQSQCGDAIPDEHDRHDVQVRYDAILRTIAARGTTTPEERSSGPDQDGPDEPHVSADEDDTAPAR